MFFVESILQSGDINDQFKDSKIRAMRLTIHNLKGRIFGVRTVHTMERNMCWEDKEWLPGLGILASSHSMQVLGSMCTHVKTASSFPEKKKDMEDTCSSLRSAKAAKEVQYKTLQTKVENIYDICEGSRKAAEE